MTRSHKVPGGNKIYAGGPQVKDGMVEVGEDMILHIRAAYNTHLPVFTSVYPEVPVQPMHFTHEGRRARLPPSAALVAGLGMVGLSKITFAIDEDERREHRRQTAIMSELSAADSSREDDDASENDALAHLSGEDRVVWGRPFFVELTQTQRLLLRQTHAFGNAALELYPTEMWLGGHPAYYLRRELTNLPAETR